MNIKNQHILSEQ